MVSVWQAGDHIGATLVNEPNTWSWNELMTRDLDGAMGFYEAAFGWETDAMDMGEMGTYHVVRGGEEGIAGMMAMPPDMPAQVPNHWVVYFLVDDAQATADRAVELGGIVAHGPAAQCGRRVGDHPRPAGRQLRDHATAAGRLSPPTP